MNVKRGLFAALVFSFIGAGSAFLVVFALGVVNWFVNETPASQRRLDTLWLASAWSIPSIIAAIYFGLAALATYTARTRFRFVGTFSIIFFVAIPLTAFLEVLNFIPQRSRGIDHPVLYPSELALLVLPPSLVTFLLLAGRVDIALKSSSKIKETEPGHASEALDRPL